MNDIDFDGMTDEQLMQIAGVSQNAHNEQTEQQQTASQTQSFDQNAGYTPEQMDSMTDEQLLRIAGIAHPQNGYSGTVQTSQGVPAEQENPDAPKPLSDAEREEFARVLDVLYRRCKAESKADFPEMSAIMKDGVHDEK